MQLNRVAITGGSGMLGFAVKKNLADQNISCLDITRQLWDLNNWLSDQSLGVLLKDVDAVIHMAAFTPHSSDVVESVVLSQLFDINVRSSLCLFAWCCRHDIPLLYLSGATVYLDQRKVNIQENDERTCQSFGGFYGFTKYLSEEIACNIYGENGKLIVLRPSSIYGPKMEKNRMVSKFLHYALDGKKIQISSSRSKVNLVFSEDVAKAIILSLKNDSWGIFNIASNATSSILDIANSCIEVAGRGSVVVENDKINFIRYALDCSKAKKRFGYEPSFSLMEGLVSMKEQILKNDEYL